MHRLVSWGGLWSFPKLGVPRVPRNLPFYVRIFHHKPSTLGYPPPFQETPRLVSACSRRTSALCLSFSRCSCCLERGFCEFPKQFHMEPIGNSIYKLVAGISFRIYDILPFWFHNLWCWYMYTVPFMGYMLKYIFHTWSVYPYLWIFIQPMNLTWNPKHMVWNVIFLLGMATNMGWKVQTGSIFKSKTSI